MRSQRPRNKRSTPLNAIPPVEAVVVVVVAVVVREVVWVYREVTEVDRGR